MNTNQKIRNFIAKNTNRPFTARDIQRALDIPRYTHVSNELGACLSKRAHILKEMGVVLEKVSGKGTNGRYTYISKPIVESPSDEYIIPVTFSLKDVPLKAMFQEIERRTI